MAGIHADERALVAREQKDVGKVGIDPEILIVIAARRAAKARPRFASVGRAHGDNARAVNDVRIFRIHTGHGQIAAANAQCRPRVAGDARPVFSRVVGAVNPDARLVRGHRRVQAARPARRDGHVHLNDPLRQPVRERAPGLSPIGRFEKAPARAAVLIAVFPRAETNLPQRCVDHIGTRGIHFDVRAADVRVFRKNFLPILSAVGRQIDAPLFTCSVRVPKGRGKNAVGVPGVNRQGGDALGVAQAKVRPGLARVGGFVDAVTQRQVRPRQAFAAANVNDVGIGRRHGNRANGFGGLAVKHGIPGAAVIVRPPHASVDRTHVKNVGLARHAASSARPASARGTDHAPAHFLVRGFGDLRPGRIRTDGRKNDERKRENAGLTIHKRTSGKDASGTG